MACRRANLSDVLSSSVRLCVYAESEKQFNWLNHVFVQNTVELQWLEHLWDHGNSFETWVVRATEG